MSADLTALLDLLERRLAVVRPTSSTHAGALQHLDLSTNDMTYAEVVRAIQAIAGTLQPADVPIAVVSKGDRSLIDLGTHPGWHLPQTSGGLYAGYHPKDGPSAVAHLEELRARGAAYLIVPRTAFWWFSYYGELTAHLRQFSTVEVADGSCRVYRLDGERDVTGSTASDLQHVIEEQRRRLEHLEQLVADLHRGPLSARLTHSSATVPA